MSARWSDGKRVTTVHDRFSVVDANCGTVETWGSRSDAEACARRHMGKHLDDSVTHVAIYDRMARRGATHAWHVDRHGHVTPQPRTEK